MIFNLKEGSIRPSVQHIILCGNYSSIEGYQSISPGGLENSIYSPREINSLQCPSFPKTYFKNALLVLQKAIEFNPIYYKLVL